MPAKPAPKIYQLKVTLKRVRPPVWRRIQVPADLLLSELHDVLQDAMGWSNYHLHAFHIAGEDYFSDPESVEDMGGKLTSSKRLRQLVKAETARFDY